MTSGFYPLPLVADEHDVTSVTLKTCPFWPLSKKSSTRYLSRSVVPCTLSNTMVQSDSSWLLKLRFVKLKEKFFAL